MANVSEFYYHSASGKNVIHAKKYLPASTDYRGVIQIAHGIAEHIERYDEFMTFLASNGFIVVGNDHLGHGKSISTDTEKGIFSENDGWNTVVKDIIELHDIIAKEYNNIPYIFFGHSMGSFLIRTVLIDYPDKYDGAIISGTGHQSPVMILAGNMLADILIKKNGYSSNGQQLNDIAFGSYLNRIPTAKTPFDWISTDDIVVQKYIDDPMCGFVASSGLYGDMMKGIKYITNSKNINRMNKDKPIYFMSGKQDPVGDYGKGVEKAFTCFKKAGMKDVSMRLYPDGRHEMLNETNKELVYQDILNWLNNKI